MNIGLIILLISFQLEAVIGQQETGNAGQFKSDGHTSQALPPLDCQNGDDECSKLQQSLGELEDVNTQVQTKSVTPKINGNVGSSQVRDKDTSYASKKKIGQAKQGDSTIANQADFDDDADKSEWRTDGRYTQKRVGQHQASNYHIEDSKHKESIKHWLLREVNVLKSAVSTIFNKLFNHKGEDFKTHDSTFHSRFFHTGNSKMDRNSHKSTLDSGIFQRGQGEITEKNTKSDKENAHGSKRQMTKDERRSNVDSGATRSKSKTHRHIDHEVMKEENHSNDVSAHVNLGVTRIKTTTHRLIDRLTEKAMKSNADRHADHAENHNENGGNDNEKPSKAVEENLFKMLAVFRQSGIVHKLFNKHNSINKVHRNNLRRSGQNFQEETVHQRLKRQAHNDQFDDMGNDDKFEHETISDDDNSPVHYAGKPDQYNEKNTPHNRHRRSMLLDAITTNVDESVSEKVKQQDIIKKVDWTPIQSHTDVSNKHLPEHETMKKLTDSPTQKSTDVFKKKHEAVKKRGGTPVQSTTTLLSKLIDSTDIFNIDIPDPSIMPEMAAANYSQIWFLCSGILAIIIMCLLFMVIGKYTMVWCKRRREPSDFEKMNHIYFTGA